MIINHNMNALNAHRSMMSNVNRAGKSMEKLSSGLRINRAGDDAAGLAISEKMRGQIRGLDQAGRNSQDGISMIQTAEGALNETHSILQRMRELATQASNDTNTSVDRGEIQKEINQLTSEINRVGNTTEFNTQKLLNGDRAKKASVAATQGEYNISAIAAGTLTIDGEDITIGATVTAAAIQTLVNSNTALAAKYTVGTGTASGTVKLTQKTGSDTEPSVNGGTLATATTGVSAKDASDGVTFQVGANAGQSMVITINDMRATSTGTNGLKIASESGTSVTSNSGKTAKYTTTAVVTDGTDNTARYKALDVSTNENASAAIDVLNDSIQSVSAERSKLGAYQNRLEHTINNLGTSSENLQAAESRVRDVDMAKEMMTFSKENILQQAAQAMLAQAKQQPQGVLQLLR
ncbi:flagellin [Clostridium aestuarii]|uniref:Flagellin n=1 Tax=Clostridium aestuarii TaxID=338193 RepID=A0ABT4D0T7_9CLOT|nr:flagellin [Clostridium aestuarii]MCY6483668.1 flagellin [Clostridium aestuarii]